MNKKSAFFNKKTPSDSEITDKLVATVNDARIVAAYREIYKEIESLRLYDRGEKTIVAPNLADIMPSIQQSR